MQNNIKIIIIILHYTYILINGYNFDYCTVLDQRVLCKYT